MGLNMVERYYLIYPLQERPIYPAMTSILTLETLMWNRFGYRLALMDFDNLNAV